MLSISYQIVHNVNGLAFSLNFWRILIRLTETALSSCRDLQLTSPLRQWHFLASIEISQYLFENAKSVTTF